MASDFSRTLALLRREKKISQRTAAGELQVSQALLSHYENGLREPGLSFVVRAADYYGVSCDYLLGRSMARDGSAVPAERMAESDAPVSESAEKKLVTEAAGLLFDVVGRTGSRQLPRELASYFSVAIYKAFRYLYMAAPESVDAVFRTRGEHFEALCDAQLKLCELRLRMAAEGEGLFGVEAEEIELPPLSPAELTERYPKEAESLLTLLQTVSDTITVLGDRRAPGDRKSR